MVPLTSIFDGQAGYDAAADFEAFLKQAPARWVVYLLADAQDQPVQLLCVKNLRASLKRRLGGAETVGLTKRINYREIVRRVYWHRVDSAFEADWVYLEAARRVFPETYQSMVGFRPAWFVHVDPKAEYPRYSKTKDLAERAGLFIGPVEDKHGAARLIELAEDCFSLCRYYRILTESPHGKACAYKEMGKCPAPCDGSIPMDEYRRMVELSARTVVAPGEALGELTRQMQQAAAALQFEAAGRIKTRIDQVLQFGQGAFRHARRLEDFSFLSLQRGPREGTGKVFLITPGEIEEVAGLIDESLPPTDLLRYVRARAAQKNAGPVTEEGAERIGMVTHHLFSAKATQGVFLRLGEIDEAAVLRGFRELRKQKLPEPEDEGEGVVKELQAME